MVGARAVFLFGPLNGSFYFALFQICETLANTTLLTRY